MASEPRRWSCCTPCREPSTRLGWSCCDTSVSGEIPSLELLQASDTAVTTLHCPGAAPSGCPAAVLGCRSRTALCHCLCPVVRGSTAFISGPSAWGGDVCVVGCRAQACGHTSVTCVLWQLCCQAPVRDASLW